MELPPDQLFAHYSRTKLGGYWAFGERGLGSRLVSYLGCFVMLRGIMAAILSGSSPLFNRRKCILDNSLHCCIVSSAIKPLDARLHCTPTTVYALGLKGRDGSVAVFD